MFWVILEVVFGVFLGVLGFLGFGWGPCFLWVGLCWFWFGFSGFVFGFAGDACRLVFRVIFDLTVAICCLGLCFTFRYLFLLFVVL